MFQTEILPFFYVKWPVIVPSLSQWSRKSWAPSFFYRAFVRVHSIVFQIEEDDMAENRFAIDYAKLGTSGCKKCKAKIAKGEIRIAKITPSPFSEGDTMKIYHHVACMFDTFLHARATTKIIESSTDLDGWSNISPADRETVLDQIKRVETARTSKTSGKSPSKKSTATASKTVTPTKKKQPAVVASPMEDDDESTVDYDEIEVLEKKEEKTTVDVHRSSTDDSKHADNSFRQFRGLCTKMAETNGHLAKTAIVQNFITDGSDGEGYKGQHRDVGPR